MVTNNTKDRIFPIGVVAHITRSGLNPPTIAGFIINHCKMNFTPVRIVRHYYTIMALRTPCRLFVAALARLRVCRPGGRAVALKAAFPRRFFQVELLGDDPLFMMVAFGGTARHLFKFMAHAAGHALCCFRRPSVITGDYPVFSMRHGNTFMADGTALLRIVAGLTGLKLSRARHLSVDYPVFPGRLLHVAPPNLFYIFIQ